MKKHVLFCAMLFTLAIGTTACGLMKKGNETETTIETNKYAMEEYQSVGDEEEFYDETEVSDTEYLVESDDNYNLSDEDVIKSENEHVVSDSEDGETVTSDHFSIGDDIPVLLESDGTTYNAILRVANLETGNTAEVTIAKFNNDSTNEVVIDPLPEDLEYGVLTYDLKLLDSKQSIVAPISSELPIRICGVNKDQSDDLVFNGKIYEGGTTYYLKSQQIKSSESVTNSIVYCVPKGCNEYYFRIGNQDTLLKR